MKNYTLNLIESTASPLYEVTITEDNDVQIKMFLAVSNDADIESAVQEAYNLFKNPFKPAG